MTARTSKRVKPARLGASLAAAARDRGGNPGFYHWGVVQSVETPSTLTLLLDGSDTPIPGIPYAPSYVPSSTLFDLVLVLEIAGASRELIVLAGPF